MPDSSSQEFSDERLQTLSEVLESGTVQQAVRIMNALHPAEIADLLESLPPRQRKLLWGLVDADIEGPVLLEVGDEVRNSLISEMEADEILAAAEGLDVDDLADFLQSLPDTLLQETLQGMDKQNRDRLEEVLSYPEDSAGGLMDTDLVTVRADVPLDVVLRYLRMKGELPEHTNQLFVVDRYGNYQGVMSLHPLLTQDPEMLVADAMDGEISAINASALSSDVSRMFEDLDLVTAPVVDDHNRLLGRITVDDVVDVIRDEAEHSVLSMAGLSEDHDIFAPVVQSGRRRGVWLGVNLATAFLASWVIGRFTATLDQIVALAVLMPIVASMGGIAGSQTLTLVIRGQALGQVGHANVRWLLNRELAVALLNGALWALVVAAIAVLWFDDYAIGAVIGTALIINLLAAAASGVVIPFVLRQMNVDPALAGGVILTTVTDVIGFVAFLGLATVFLLR
jgi:magnesium transporter